MQSATMISIVQACSLWSQTCFIPILLTFCKKVPSGIVSLGIEHSESSDSPAGNDGVLGGVIAQPGVALAKVIKDVNAAVAAACLHYNRRRRVHLCADPDAVPRVEDRHHGEAYEPEEGGVPRDGPP